MKWACPAPVFLSWGSRLLMNMCSHTLGEYSMAYDEA